MAEGDLLAPIIAEHQLHPSFKTLLEARGYAPHRDMLREVWKAFPNPESGFIREFQAEHFDRRIWELYVFALLYHGPFEITRPNEQPDFLLKQGNVEVWVEATTANGSKEHPVREKSIPEELLNEMYNELPLRLGSPLYSKLKEKYWELPHVGGKPLVIALGDFSQHPGVRHSDFALHRFLYGQDAKVRSLPGEVVKLEMLRVDSHSAWKTIPSAFFSWDGAENISAVVFSNEGTLAKFGRMGFEFDMYPYVRMIRVGGCVDFDPTATYPKAFGYLVGDVPEDWGHGAYVYHNPRAVNPLPLDFFRGIGGQHWMGPDGELHNEFRAFSPFSSLTTTFQAPMESNTLPIDDAMLRKMALAKAMQLEEENKKTLQFHAWRDKLI